MGKTEFKRKLDLWKSTKPDSWRKKRADDEKKRRKLLGDSLREKERERNKKREEYLKKYRREYYQANIEKLKAQQKRYRQSNPNIGNEIKRRYKNRKHGLESTLTNKEWLEILKKYNYSCAYCYKKTKLTKDHKIPASHGGGYTKENIVPACSSCNSRKHTKTDTEFRILLGP